ncbi:MAG: M6 family metalloprotease domain-containing protein [Acidobacteriota bacterium]
MKPGTMTSLPLRIAAAALLAGASIAAALEPPTREQIAQYKADGTYAARVARAKAFGNHRFAPRLVSRVKDRLRLFEASEGKRATSPARKRVRAAAPPPAWSGMPTSGTVKVLALLIDFGDYGGVTPTATFEDRLFGDGQGTGPFDSLRSYYLRSSYDQLDIQGDVLGWYTPGVRSAVAETDAGREAVIKEALNYYNEQGHDFSQYDNDGDGAIDYFCVFWAGPHGEWSSFWWGYYTSFSDASYRLDGKRLSQYSWQWELYSYPSGSFSPQTIIHETGHALGVPDYYDYDDTVGPRGGVGNLDIMDGNAGDHNAFSKFMLDWISPTVVSAGPQTVSLRASGLTSDALIFMPGAVPGLIFDEYFVVQNRQRTGNDTGLFTGSDGLLVWHVDARLTASGSDFRYDNSYTAHKLLKLMEADGLEEIETYGASAEAADYYKAGMGFGPSGTPNTSRYNGTPTAMGITNITGTTSPISLDVYGNDEAPTCSIASPTAGQTVSGSISIEVSAEDADGIASVQAYADGALIGTLASAPYSFPLDTTTLENGVHILAAKVTDLVLQTASDSVTVNVANFYPPAAIAGRRTVNRSALLKEYLNVLTWTDDPRNTLCVKFRVYAVAGGARILLGEVTRDKLTGPYGYLHRRIDRLLTYTYNVTAVGSQGEEGEAAAVTVP